MNPLVKKYGIKYGLIIAAISVGYYLVAYLFNEQLFANMFAGIGIMITGFVLLIMSVVSLKKEQGGFISFKEAVSVFTFSWIVNALISLVFTLLLFHVIDPDLGDRIKEITIETTISWMEKFDTPEEAMEEAIQRVREQDNYSVTNIILGNLTSIVFALIVGLIVAAFFKKDKPIFEETVD